MSSEENNRHLWGSFPHQRAAGRGCCLARTSAAPGRAIPAPLAVPVTLTRVPALPRGHPGETCTTAKPKTGWKKVPKLLLSSPGSTMLTHCLCEQGQAPAQGAACLPREQTPQPSPALGTLIHHHCWQPGARNPGWKRTVQTPSYANHVDTGKPGLLENPNRDLIGVTRRSEKWQRPESRVSAVTPGGSTVTIC